MDTPLPQEGRGGLKMGETGGRKRIRKDRTSPSVNKWPFFLSSFFFSLSPSLSSSQNLEQQREEGGGRRGREREGVSNESGERTLGLFLCALQCQCEVFSLIEGPFSLLCGVKAVLIE